MLSCSGAADERMTGSSYIAWIKEQCAADDVALTALGQKLAQIAKKIFVRGRMTVSVSENAGTLLEKVMIAFPEGTAASAMVVEAEGVDQLGLPIPAAVGFASKAAKLSGKYSGSTYVLANVLNYSYLWNEIRVQGGAYGCGFSGRDNGDLVYYTYRDPQPCRSLGIFDKAPEFIREFCAADPDLTPMILGAMASADPLLNAQRKIGVAEMRFFKGTTYEDVCRIRQELIGTSKEDILAMAAELERIAETNAVCVVAGQPLLDECGDSLQKIIPIL